MLAKRREKERRCPSINEVWARTLLPSLIVVLFHRQGPIGTSREISSSIFVAVPHATTALYRADSADEEHVNPDTINLEHSNREIETLKTEVGYRKKIRRDNSSRVK